MKSDSRFRFATRNKGEEKPFRVDLKTTVIAVIFIILILDIFGLYPRVEFNLVVNTVLYVVFFACIYFVELKKDILGERGVNRINYGLGVIYLTLACISGGITSPLKWILLLLIIMRFSSRDFVTAAIMSAALLAAFIKDWAAFISQDIFMFVVLAGFGAVTYFKAERRVNTRADAESLKRIETDKESRHFKTVIYNLLESLFVLYHDILKPVSVMYFIKDEDHGGLFTLTMSVSTKESEVIKDYSFDIKEGLLGTALNKNMFFSFDVKGVKMPYYSGKVEVKTAATIPVILNKVIGCIVIDFDREIEAEKDTVKERLNDLSGEVVSIMELYDINHKVISKEQRVSRMYEINEKLNLMEGKSGLMLNFLNEIKSFDIYSGYLAEYNPEDNSFEITDSLNYPSTVKGTKFNGRDNEFLRYLMDTGKSFIIDNAAQRNINLNFNRLNLDKNFLSLLKHGNDVYGFIKLDKEKGFAFSEFEIRTLEMMLSRITVMLENARLYEKIKKQAFHDGLTGLLNHLTFQQKLAVSIEKKNKGEIQSVALCVLDIDFFKKFNDSFGHEEGDRVLKKMAGMMTDFEKKYERTYCDRYGGEEFVFVLENYDIYGAIKIADEMRAFSAEHLKGGNEKEKRPINLSIGVTSYPEYARDPRELFKNADEALYLAKEEGRNRVKSTLDVKKVDRRKR